MQWNNNSCAKNMFWQLTIRGMHYGNDLILAPESIIQSLIEGVISLSAQMCCKMSMLTLCVMAIWMVSCFGKYEWIETPTQFRFEVFHSMYLFLLCSKIIIDDLLTNVLFSNMVIILNKALQKYKPITISSLDV